MCILCVIQKWSRRVATMLPWLVIPLIGLWALSQLLPPDFRFEITSPRLACVFVLLATLFWYEILMPRLSAWRVRRNARLRERKRFEAIELQKLRKTATRRCRNCLTPYRDQKPSGGRFMCSYCGHISKRPVLDLPGPPGLGISNSGIIKDIVGKSGKILNGKGWSENGWMCGQDWLENGNWVTGSVSGKPSYWWKNGTGDFGGNEDCLAKKSYSGIVIFACRLLTSFLSMRWLLRKIFGVSSSNYDASSDADHRGMLTKRGENGTSFHESRVEKARRKAEEKRQARLEKELLEQEERKQREEVARLVEERRRLRDEKLEAEKDCSKLSLSNKEKEIKREAENKSKERRKDKDKAFSKSHTDTEELEKRAGKETELKGDTDKKCEIDFREHLRSGSDYLKGNALETGHGIKSTPAINFSRGNENKTNNPVDHAHASANRRDFCPSERIAGKLSMDGDDKNIKINHSVLSEPQLWAAPKKSWQQLFTRSPSLPPVSNANVISRPTLKNKPEAQSPPFPSHSTIQTFDNPINFGLPSPFISMYTNGVPSSSLGFSPAIEPIFPRTAEGPSEIIPEEPELFEDPCYVPDPVSLLGPVSESLDNFQLDLGAGFGMDVGTERPCSLKNISASSEINKPSPIESPLSRSRSATPKAQDLQTSPVDDINANEKRTWQMWSSSPLGQDGLGLMGDPASWLLPLEHNRSNKDDLLHISSQKTMASLFAKEDPILAGKRSPQKVFLGNGQNGGTFSPVPGLSDHDPWLQDTSFPPVYGSDNHFPNKSLEEMSYGSLNGSAGTYPFEPSAASCWPKKEWGATQDSEQPVGKSSISRPHVGGLFHNQMYSHFVT
ncbi:Autophagy-related 13 [Gossypium australe]|uniref:Autophagy-related 13 n=1 Tax=Gossypium australe TaxID=47621 RepID=A0A5B6WQX1_9ROSI|nr:Autophagy-related 13 [Gossypium australe]